MGNHAALEERKGEGGKGEGGMDGEMRREIEKAATLAAHPHEIANRTCKKILVRVSLQL